MRCRRCIVRSDFPGVLLDGTNLCNICSVWDSLEDRLTDFSALKEVFVSKLSDVKGQCEYDAVVGLSGGKDGAYVLHALTKEYGLRVLALTLDLGFMPNTFAKENAARVTSALGVEHETVRLPDELVRKLFSNYLSKPTTTTPCHLCTSILGLALGIKVAVEFKIPKIVAGLDRGQLLNKLHLKHARRRVLESIGPHKRDEARRNLEKTISRLNLYFRWLGLNANERSFILPSPRPISRLEEVPEIMMYFLHHPHDEEEIKRLLERETGWIRPDGDIGRGHFDCELKELAGEAANRLGLGGRLEYELSVDIREGALTRDQALARLAKEGDSSEGTQSPFHIVESRLGMSQSGFESKVDRLAKIAPYYAKGSNALIRAFGLGGRLEKLLFLIRPH